MEILRLFSFAVLCFYGYSSAHSLHSSNRQEVGWLIDWLVCLFIEAKPLDILLGAQTDRRSVVEVRRAYCRYPLGIPETHICVSFWIFFLCSLISKCHSFVSSCNVHWVPITVPFPWYALDGIVSNCQLPAETRTFEFKGIHFRDSLTRIGRERMKRGSLSRMFEN